MEWRKAEYEKEPATLQPGQNLGNLHQLIYLVQYISPGRGKKKEGVTGGGKGQEKRTGREKEILRREKP